MEKPREEYNGQLLAKARNAASLRAVVAGYLVYLGYTLIRDYFRGESSMTPWLAWAAGLGFCAAGAAFGYYTWRQYQTARAAAKLPEKEEAPEES